MIATVRGWFLENLGLKAFALLVSLVLFVYVSDRRGASSTVGVRVKLVVRTAPNTTITSPLPEDVQVSLSGSWPRVKSLSREDIPPITIDLTGQAAGPLVYYLQRDFVKVPTGLAITSLSPAAIPLTLEELTTREVPVVASLRGTPSEGRRVLKYRTEPRSVRLRGPKRVLDRVDYVMTEAVDLTDRVEGFVRDARVLVDDPSLVSEGTSKVRVSVALGPAPEPGEEEGTGVAGGVPPAIAPERAAAPVVAAPPAAVDGLDGGLPLQPSHSPPAPGGTQPVPSAPGGAPVPSAPGGAAPGSPLPASGTLGAVDAPPPSAPRGGSTPPSPLSARAEVGAPIPTARTQAPADGAPSPAGGAVERVPTSAGAAPGAAPAGASTPAGIEPDAPLPKRVPRPLPRSLAPAIPPPSQEPR